MFEFEILLSAYANPPNFVRNSRFEGNDSGAVYTNPEIH